LSAAPFAFFVTAARGTEGALRQDLRALRIAGLRGERGGMHFEGPLGFGMKVCLHARSAMRVLLELGTFPAADAAALYEGVRGLDLAPWLTPHHTLAVRATVRDTPALHHTGFAALKVKDALVDAVRDRSGARPDVNAESPDVAFALHVDRGQAHLYLDLGGDPLHRRGYRVAMTEAPLKETLAAAILTLGRVEPEAPLADPMCGSGTFAIEQAMRARKLAPGRLRRFGFERWPTFAGELASTWKALKDEASAQELPRAPAVIVAAERDANALAATRRNAEAAGVARDLTFVAGSARDLRLSGAPGAIVTNPPYGERLDADVYGAFDELASLKQRYPEWAVVVLAGHPDLERRLGGKPAISQRLWNGPLPVRMLVYASR